MRTSTCVLVFLCAVVSAADHDGQCVMRGICDSDIGEVPCLYNGPPIPLEGAFLSSHNMTDVQLLETLCPDFVDGPNPSTCCDREQILQLKDRLGVLDTVGFSRCPSCSSNFRKLICHFSCSPNQSKFFKVNRTGEYDDLVVVEEAVFFVAKRFAYEMYESCKGIRGFMPGTLVFDYGICGHWGSKHCNPERWIEYIGSTYEEGGHSPYKIHYVLTMRSTHEAEDGEVFYPMNAATTKCSESPGPGIDKCSCNDCEDACSADSQPPVLPLEEEPFMIGEYDAPAVIALIAFLTLSVLFTVSFCYGRIRSNRNKANDSSKQNGYNGNGANLVNSNHGVNLGSLEEVSPLRPRVAHQETHLKRWVSDSGASVLTIEEAGSKFELIINSAFRKWGKFVFTHPIKLIIISLLVSAVLSSGLLVNFNITTNPVDLWVSPSSQARQHMEYFNKHFGPFYRIEQLIITPVNKDPFYYSVPVQHEYVNLTWGPVFRKDFMLAVLDLQKTIENLSAEKGGKNVQLKDICLNPIGMECAIQSVFGFFQNNASFFDEEAQYLRHFKYCSMTPRDQKCFAPYGGHLDSTEVVLGGFEGTDFETAQALIITIPVMNYYEQVKNEEAMIWEEKFLAFLENFSHPLMDVAYKAERSIEDELERGSHSDILTVAISYLLMLCYITIALGEVHGCGTLFVDSKFTLGLVGVLIVLVSVVSSLGAFSYVGIPATLIIVEVIPFLVLAVGVDNIFILVQAFQRDRRGDNETLIDQMSRVVGDVAPSMMLSSISMSSCFFIGALTEMPAVKIFALYAGVALLVNFFLQMTCFLALFSLDTRRQASNRLDACCCIRASKTGSSHSERSGVLYRTCKVMYAPFLMKDAVRYVVVIVFMGWLFLSISAVPKVDVGLNQELSVPEDSYMLRYFRSLNKYLSVGPPVYFVITDGYDYSSSVAQKAICSSLTTCDSDSLTTQLGWMARLKNQTYVALQPVAWVDTFFEFMRSESCCFKFEDNDTFCPSQYAFENKGSCYSCQAKDISKLSYNEFLERVEYFLMDIPWERCSKSGKAMFKSAVEMLPDEDYGRRIGATYFMTYHTVLKSSKDFYEALRWSREISANLTKKISSVNPDIEVFPYSLVHVFYEQYLTMWPDTLKSLGLSIAAVFIATFLLLGLDFHSAVIVVLTIVMIIINLMGLMYWWDISLNAVSLVNLVVAVGISVEFCSHLTRAFALSPKRTRVERAEDALCKMGSSVLSGITLTDCGILVLVFAKSQIFQVFYFRMYLGIIAFGTLHSLIFLPVLLSLVGPPAKKFKKREDTLLQGRSSPCIQNMQEMSQI